MGDSYLSSHDRREILGLGDASAAEEIEIRWPSEGVDRISDAPVKQYARVVDGKGIIVRE